MYKSIVALFILLVPVQIKAQSSCWGGTGATSEGNYVLVWSDEFEQEGAVCTENWHHQTLLPAGGGWYNGEIQHYTNRIENSFVENGHLKLVAKKESFTDQGHTKQYTSARLNSKFAFTYGKVEVRAKLPFGVGTWPAIWTLGRNISEQGGYWYNDYGNTPWPVCGEIDIMEHWGDNQNWIQAAMHTPSSHGGTVNKGGINGSDVSNTFHTYSMIWEEESIEFYYDDVNYYTYQPKVRDSNTWPYTKPQYLLLNIAILPIINESFIESSMEIDYVRIYQKNAVGPPPSIPEVAASAHPEREEWQVISVFSDSYTDLENTDFEPSGTQTTSVDNIQIDGNTMMKYSDFNFQSIIFEKSQDLRAMEFLNVDVWTTSATSIRVSPIDPNGSPQEVPAGLNPLVAGEWNTYAIPMSLYKDAGMDLSNISQLKFDGQLGVTPSEVYVDNLYFYNNDPNPPTVLSISNPEFDFFVSENQLKIKNNLHSHLIRIALYSIDGRILFDGQINSDTSTIKVSYSGLAVLKATDIASGLISTKKLLFK